VTNVPATQPLTRRERRRLEEEEAAAAAAAAQLPVANPAPVVALPPEFTPAPTLPPAQPLTRRERRLLEEGAPTGSTSVPEVTAPTQVAPPDPTPLPPVFAAPIAPVAAPIPAPPSVLVPEAPRPELEVSLGATTSRLVGDVSTATNSLILPTTPLVDLTSPLSSTGEVVVTGQITLPTRLAEQGTTPALETAADHDEVLDAYVTGEIAAMAKPVRASQAVSGKGDDTDIILVRRARWGTAAIVTVVVAASLALAAVGLLVLAMTTDVLG